MIVIRMNLWLVASLMLMMSLNDVTGFSITTPDTLPSDYPHKREISENTIYGHGLTAILGTSCRQTLCARAPFYPSFEIGQAVDSVRKILRSNSELDLEKKMLIDSTVIENFSTLQHVIYDYYLPEPVGCDHYMNIFVPEEGYSADDDKIYYVVNVPSYHQRVESIICTNSGDVCNNDFVQSTCNQDFREEKLLVLPVDTDFNISDFRVKPFKVPNGCTCSEVSKF